MQKAKALRDEYTRTIAPARALATETLNLERTLSDLVNQAYSLTPAEIALMWQTAPPRMPIPSLQFDHVIETHQRAFVQA
jgi:diketogulonate reductase-like aldo/keto reductase